MTAIPQPASSRLLSERIAGPLGVVAMRQWKVRAAGGALRTAAAVLLLLLAAAIVLGFFAAMPAWLRMTVAALVWALILAAVVGFLRPVLRRRSLTDAARAVERATPGLDERLSSTVELSAESEPFAGSPALLRHLARQAEADAAAVRPEHVVSAGAVRRRAILLGAMALLWLALAVLFPRTILGGLYRTLMPWRSHLPAMLATIAVSPGDVTLPEGDALAITAKLNVKSGAEASAASALLLTKPLMSSAGAEERPLARDLHPVAPREFAATLGNLRQSIRYQVATDLGDSPWFTATVLPRPAVASLDVRYDYPAYAAIDAKTVTGSDGNLRALQGTDVTLAIHATEPLDLSPGNSRISVAEGPRRRTIDLNPVDGNPNVYEAKLTVFNSGSYEIHLVNTHGLDNPNEEPRTITAEFDAPPKVAITAPESQVTVRPDDDVPVLFTATDDFGIGGVRAVVQVDDRPPVESDVPAPSNPSADGRRVNGECLLSVARHLGQARVEHAKTITYWLTVSDNRDPDPQTVESARQTLKIDDNQSLGFRARIEQDQAKNLTQAIDKAIQRLQHAEGQVNSLKNVEAKRAFNPDETRRADEQRDHLATTGKDLGEAAESNLRTAFAEVADKALQIAEGPIQGAAENVAKARLSADQGALRNQSTQRAAEQVVDARKQLEALKKQVEERARAVAASRELEKLAEKQTQLAEAQAKLPPTTDADDTQVKQQRQQAQHQSQQRQRELLERLNRTLGQNESLREAKAVEQAVRLRELIDRVQEIQKQQTPLQEQVAKQQQVAALEERAEGLVERQEKLIAEIEAFSDRQRDPLRRADARPPDPNHQVGIVDRLRKGEVDPAREMQKQSADQLKQAAKQLEERGRSNDLKPDAFQQNALNLQDQAKQHAQHLAEQARQAGDKLKQAKAAANAEQTAQAQKEADSAAEALKKHAANAEVAVAQAIESDDSTAKKAAEETKKAADAAEAAADAAKNAAQQGNAEQAAQQLAEAGRHLAAARQKAADAIRAAFVDDQRDASKTAADQAKDLADRQKELAEAAKGAAEVLAKARRDQQSPQDVANRQNQLKDQTNQARQHADQLEQLARSNKSPLAERVAAAEKLLEDAAAAEAQAAQEENATAQAQQQAAQALQQAAQADQQAVQLDNQSDQAAEQADGHRQQADAAGQNASAAEARGDAGGAKGEKERAGRETQQAEQDRQRATTLDDQADAAQTRAAAAVKQADTAQGSAAAARKRAADKQAQAQDALAKAEAELRDVDRMLATAAGAAQAGEAERRDPQGADDANPQAGDSPGANENAQAAADGTPSAGDGAGAGQSPPPPMSPEDALRQAAQSAQEASQAQQQALNSGNDAASALDASQQAAAALQQAAAAMAAATASSSPASSSSDPATAQPDVAGAARGDATASRPGRTLDSRHGVGLAAGASDERPTSVQQLGISAGDWARLGPLTQRELLNAAQQNGPPAYREMIKNYYIRIARLERDARRKE